MKQTTTLTLETSSQSAKELNKRVVDLVKLADPYIDEFKKIKTKKDALIWCKSIPDNLKDIVLCLLSIAKIEDGFNVF